MEWGSLEIFPLLIEPQQAVFDPRDEPTGPRTDPATQWPPVKEDRSTFFIEPGSPT